MKNYLLNPSAGSQIDNVAEMAKQIAVSKDVTVEFMFNEIKCLVNKQTVIEWLVRDYLNAHIMNWKTIGPECEIEYEPEVEIELYRRRLAAAIKRKQEMVEYKAEQNRKEENAKKKIGDEEMEFSDKKGYDEWKAKNTDPYGEACFTYAERWAKLMQKEMKKGISIAQCADKLSREADIEGITGFMYGMAVTILSKTWKYGEELRKWHNKEYSVEGDGVANPAILTVK